MKKFPLFLFALLFATHLFSQSYEPIRVVDAKTNEPLSYARIYNIKTGRGLVCNEDGVFRYAFKDNTTAKPIIRVSYVGYESAFYSPVELCTMKTVLLKTNTYALAEVVVMPKSWAMDFLHQVIKRHKKLEDRSIPAKVYYSSHSAIDKQPVEMIELLINGVANLTQVKELRYKSGRIAHASFNNTYFLNLQPRKYITSFKPFDNQRTVFPATFTGNNRLSNNLFYDVTFVKQEYTSDDTLYHFECQSKKSWLMDAELIASKKFGLFQSIKYSYPQIPSDLFQPINADDRITDGRFIITATFDLHLKAINSVVLEYDIDYLFANGKQSKIHMQANSLFYDLNSSFIDIMGRNLDKVNDYDLTYNMSYFEQLWQQETPGYSRRQNAYIEYFQKNGSLVNYGNSNSYLAAYVKRFRPWSPERLQFSDLNAAKLYWYKEHENDHLDYNPSELIRIEAQNVFDVVALHDTILWKSKTIIDLNESFCFLVPNISTWTYMNIYFDLYKVAEKELLNSIPDSKQTISLENVFKSIGEKTAIRIDEFTNKVRLGKNTQELLFWNKLVVKELNINNIDSAKVIYNKQKHGDSIIYDPFQDSLTFIHNYYDKYAKESFYNNGVILAKIGRTEEAINEFTKSINSVENEPYAYYNRAVLHLQQQDTVSACSDLEKALQLGVEETENLINRYCIKSENEIVE